jgi:hypothetical protein
MSDYTYWLALEWARMSVRLAVSLAMFLLVLRKTYHYSRNCVKDFE